MEEAAQFKETFIIVGKTIRQKREAQSISVPELANRLGMSKDRLRSIEDGTDFDITISELILISIKLDVPLSEILVDSIS